MFRGLILLPALWAVSLFAHDAGLSTARVVLESDRIDVTVSYAPPDARVLLSGSGTGSKKDKNLETPDKRAALEELAPLLCKVEVDGKSLLPIETQVEFAADDNVAFRYQFQRSAALEQFAYVALDLGALPSAHREHFQTFDAQGNLLAEAMLSAKTPSCSVRLKTRDAGRDTGNRNGTSSFVSFLKLGVEHIWTGYDHLLFLLGLLVVCRSFRASLSMITCFTLAHSLTLAFASFDLIQLSSRWVEPAIAASIVFVGVENLIQRGAQPKGRALLTFCFGLIHGFGFASVLKDLGVGSGGQAIAMPLLSFNLGVELGQGIVAAVALPFLWKLRKWAWFRAWGIATISAAISVAGLYWLIQRIVLA